MRICFISHAPGLGGAERILLETIETLADKGVECRVLLSCDRELARELRSRNIPIAIVPGRWWVSVGRPSFWERMKALIKIGASIWPTVKKIKEWKSDLIYSNTVTVCEGAIAGAILGIPHIWHLQEFIEENGLVCHLGSRLTRRMLDRLSTRTIVLSKALADYYGQFIERSKLAVVYPSMHQLLLRSSKCAGSSAANLTKAGRFRCVVVGGLTYWKGQEDAIGALAVLAKRGIKVELTIVGGGEGKYPAYLKKIVRLNHLQDQVTFAGRVENGFPFMENSDVVIVCSRAEGFGRVTIEAMLAGKPIIGAKTGATAELILEGSTGLFYKVQDPSDLAARIIYLRDNPSVALWAAENGKEWARKIFTKERYASELLVVLNSLSTKIQVRSPLNHTWQT
jgi:glycosyltransferase involved in cell wall biosynthesis